MKKEVLVLVLNEWMRRYIDEPEVFETEFDTVRDFLKQDCAGEEPTYGVVGAEYMVKIAEDLGL